MKQLVMSYSTLTSLIAYEVAILLNWASLAIGLTKMINNNWCQTMNKSSFVPDH